MYMHINQSTFREIWEIYGCEGVVNFLPGLSTFFIISGRYSKYGELPVIISCLFFFLFASHRLCLLFGEKSTSKVLLFSLH